MVEAKIIALLNVSMYVEKIFKIIISGRGKGTQRQVSFLHVT